MRRFAIRIGAARRPRTRIGQAMAAAGVITMAVMVGPACGGALAGAPGVSVDAIVSQSLATLDTTPAGRALTEIACGPQVRFVYSPSIMATTCPRAVACTVDGHTIVFGRTLAQASPRQRAQVLSHELVHVVDWQKVRSLVRSHSERKAEVWAETRAAMVSARVGLELGMTDPSTLGLGVTANGVLRSAESTARAIVIDPTYRARLGEGDRNLAQGAILTTIGDQRVTRVIETGAAAALPAGRLPGKLPSMAVQSDYPVIINFAALFIGMLLSGMALSAAASHYAQGRRRLDAVELRWSDFYGQ